MTRWTRLFVLAAILGGAASSVRADDVPPPPPPKPPAAGHRLAPAPRPACVFVPVDLALWSSVNLNALYPPCARNLFGFALLAGKAGELRGLQLGGLGQWATRSVRGVQLAGLGVAGGEDVVGLQIAGLVAAAGKGLKGVQLSTIAAAGGHSQGLQLGALGAASGERATGVQIGGLFAATSRLAGLQLAGGASISRGGHGLQLAGAVTRDLGELTGAQIAIVNIGQTVRGAQIGLVNIARQVHGVQLGLVNVADRADAPLGLVSWIRGGDRAVELWGGEAVPIAAAARFGTGAVYSLVGLAADPLHARTTWGPVGGFGLRLPAGPLAIHLDALGHTLLHGGLDGEALLAQARARLAVPIAERVSAFAGVTWNVFVSSDDDGAGLPLGLDRVSHHGDLVVRQWPGFTAGAAVRY